METWVLTVAIFTASTILAIIGFFLRSAYSSINKQIETLTLENQKRIEDQGKLKGKFELLEQENRLKLQHIEENTQHEIRVMATKIGDLSDTVGELVRIQMNGSTRRRNNNN
jgi:cell division protein FtsB